MMCVSYRSCDFGVHTFEAIVLPVVLGVRYTVKYVKGFQRHADISVNR